MRHEIGIDTIAFGRDYPHPEGTWPNTVGWIREAFEGVPEPELRKMLGENAIGRLGLDGVALDAVVVSGRPDGAGLGRVRSVSFPRNSSTTSTYGGAT